jgi:hypothetical protein
MKVSVALRFSAFVCTSPCCHCYCVYVCIYICWVTKVACFESDAVKKVCEWITNRHDDVEFYRRKTLKLCRVVLHRFEVGFAQELNLYIYMSNLILVSLPI